MDAGVLRWLEPRERRGSKPRCHLLTHGDRSQVAASLTNLIRPWGQVLSSDVWLRRGFDDTREPRLGETPEFLSRDLREQLTDWWLTVRERANTPNWDIVSTCAMRGEKGLVLIEAKAHSRELSRTGKRKPSTPNGRKNHRRICRAFREVNHALNRERELRQWLLRPGRNYQLANRFAWAYKLASLGVPVILVYLGFLDADEMSDRGRPFRTTRDWEQAVRTHAAGTVPDKVWNEKPLDIYGTPLWALIRSHRIPLPGGNR